MPLDGYDAVTDYDGARYNAGVTPKVDGSVELTPDNFIPDENFRELSADGAPPGHEAVYGPEMEGYYPYITQVGGARSTLHKQAFSPIPPDQDIYQFAAPVVSGGAPVGGHDAVIPAQDLEAPVLGKVASADAGFPAGTYGAAITLVGMGGSHTMPTSDGPTVTVSATGKLIEFNLLTDLDPELVAGQGLWLTEPVAEGLEPDWSTLRLQDIAKGRGRTHTLPGPYKWTGRLAPQQNETEIGVPEPFRFHRDFSLRGRQGMALQAGKWQFYRVETTRMGDSLPSRHLVLRNITSDKRDHAYIFHPTKLHPESLGYKIFVQDSNDGLNPPFYQLMRVRRGNKARYFRPEDRPIFFGIKEDGSTDSGGPEKNKGPARPLYLLVSSDPETEDSSGIESPTGEIDPPVAVGIGYPTPGTYKVGFSKVLGGKETRVSPLASITTTTAQPIIQLQFPPRVNKIPNALYGQLDQAGLPINHTIRDSANAIVSTVSANAGFDRAGVLFVKTAGQISSTGITPNVRQPSAHYIAVDRDRLETIAGFLEIEDYISGEGYVEIVQYKADKADNSTPLVLTTMAQNGKVWVEKTVAGAGLGADLELHEDTVYASVRWGAQGNPRNLKVMWHSQIWAPEEGIPRRFEPSASSLDLAIATNEPTAPYPSTHQLRIGPAPATAADVAASAPPAEITSYDSLAVGAEPSEWTETLTLANDAGTYSQTFTATVATDLLTSVAHGHKTGDAVKLFTTGTLPAPLTTSATYYARDVLTDSFKLSATPGGAAVDITTTGTGTHSVSSVFGSDTAKSYRVRSENTGGKSSAYMTKSFASLITGNSLGVVIPIYLERGPTRNPSNVHVAWIQTTGFVDLARLQVKRVNNTATPFELWLVSRDKDNNETSTLLASSLKDTDRLEVEVIVGGGATTAGTVSTNIGLNGATRSPGPGQSAIDFTGRQPRVVQIGGGTESHSDTKWTFQFGKLITTPAGYVAVSNAAPSLTAIPQPDVPMKTGVTLTGPVASPLDYTTATSGTSLGVVAQQRRTGALAAERTLARILTADGLTEVAGLYMKTDHTVEVRRGSNVYPASALVPTATNYVFDLIVEGAGTNAGTVLLYRTIGTGPRELYVQASGLDLTGMLAKRATVVDNAELLETQIRVTEHGEYEYANTIDRDPEKPIYQGYVSIIAADVVRGQENVGFAVDEFFVKPNVQRTDAFYAKFEDMPDGAKPFTVVEYDDDGVGTVIGSAYDNAPVVNITPGWGEYSLVYTPTQKRVKVEHRGMTGGRYVYQRPLDSVGNLTTQTQREAKRTGAIATSGIVSGVLNARIPAQSDTQMASQWRETRERLEIAAEVPVGTTVTGRYRSASTEAGLASATWQTSTALVPDLEWVEVEATLTGDGILTPVVPSGGIHLFYKCFQPVLLREDRSSLPGGTYIGGGSENNLQRPYRRSVFDVESVGGRAAPRAITARIGRLGAFPISIFSPEALDELQSDDFLSQDWFIESPHHDLVMKVRFYEEPSEATPMAEYALLDEGMHFWVPKSMGVERAEVVEAGELS